MLHAPGGDPEEKNQCLRALLDEVGVDDGEVAALLLILALWPGLDAVRGRLLRFYRGNVAALDAELLGRLSLEIRKDRRERVRRVAATLLRNVERDIRRDLVRRAKGRKEHQDHAEEIQHLAKSCFIGDRAVDDLDAIVCSALGRDGPLVVAVALDGLSQKEAAALLGLSHDAARKRYQRAMGDLAARAGSLSSR